MTTRPDAVVPAVPITLFTAGFIDPKQVVDNSKAGGAEAVMLFLQRDSETSPSGGVPWGLDTSTHLSQMASLAPTGGCSVLVRSGLIL